MSERQDIHDWFRDDSECISAEMAEAYRTGKLKGAEKNALERHLLTCELCAEAWEGIEAAQAEGVLSAAVADITDRAWKRAEERERKKRRGAWIWMSSAAGVALLVVAGFLLFKNGDEKRMEEAFAEQFNRYPAEERAGDGRAAAELEKGSGDSQQYAMNRAEDEPTEGLKMPDQTSSGQVFAPPPPVAMEMDDVPVNDADVNEDVGFDFSWNALNDDEIVQPTPAKEAPKDFKNIEVTDQVSESNDKRLAEKEKEEQKEVATKSIQQVTTVDAVTRDNNATLSGGVTTFGNSPASTQTVTSTTTYPQGNFQRAENLESVVVASKKSKVQDPKGRIEGSKAGVSRAKTAAKQDKGNDYGDRVVATDSMLVRSVGAAEEEVSMDDTEGSRVDNAKPAAPSNYQLGRTAYDQGNYAVAYGYLEQELKQNPSNMDAVIYAGLSQLIQEKPAAAMPYFDRVLNSGTATKKQKEDAEWYKALTFLKLKEKAKAEALLKGIEAKKGVYSPKATETLKTLD